MNKSFKVPVAALISSLAASALFLGSASADELPVSRSKQVSFAGLDLSTQSGVRAARDRVHQAARKLCQAVSDELDLSHVTNFNKCVDQAMSGAMPHFDALVNRSNASGNVALNR